MFCLAEHRIGDAWYYAEEDCVHTFFLARNLSGGGGNGIGHAVSRDLVNWEYLGLALERGPAGSWDDKNLATGSVIHRGGRYWMAYTGHKHEDFFVQRVGMSVSDDLVNWEKMSGNPTSEADPEHYEIISTGQRELTHWRDAFLLDTGEEVFQYVTARRTEGDEATRGTIGMARSVDMIHWKTLPPPEHDRITEEMEVNQVYHINGRYYLVFCTHPHLLTPEFTERFPGHVFRSTDYAMVSNSPMGPFCMYGTGEIMPEAPPGRWYASQLVQFKEEWFLLGTVGEGAESGLSDPVRVIADDKGLHADKE